MTGMHFRRAHLNDLESLHQLIAPSLSPAFHWDRSNFAAEFAFAETWILTTDSEILAFVCVRDAVDAWEISSLATAVSAQGRGYMRQLLEKVVEHYGRERHFWLEVHEGNVRAQKLYEQFGFIKEGRRGGYYKDGSSALLYTLPQMRNPE